MQDRIACVLVALFFVSLSFFDNKNNYIFDCKITKISEKIDFVCDDKDKTKFSLSPLDFPVEWKKTAGINPNFPIRLEEPKVGDVVKAKWSMYPVESCRVRIHEKVQARAATNPGEIMSITIGDPPDDCKEW